MTNYRVESFGSDCLGNISGYRVVNSNGSVMRTFVGNIYRPGSFAVARLEAEDLRDALEADQ